LVMSVVVVCDNSQTNVMYYINDLCLFQMVPYDCVIKTIKDAKRCT
jgi:hypothetical protein